MSGNGATPVTATSAVDGEGHVQLAENLTRIAHPLNAVHAAVIIGSRDTERIDIDARVGRFPVQDCGTALLWPIPNLCPKPHANRELPTVTPKPAPTIAENRRQECRIVLEPVRQPLLDIDDITPDSSSPATGLTPIMPNQDVQVTGRYR